MSRHLCWIFAIGAILIGCVEKTVCRIPATIVAVNTGTFMHPASTFVRDDFHHTQEIPGVRGAVGERIHVFFDGERMYETEDAARGN